LSDPAVFGGVISLAKSAHCPIAELNRHFGERLHLTGHGSVEMNKSYTHMELDPLRDAISAIPGVMGKKVE